MKFFKTTRFQLLPGLPIIPGIINPSDMSVFLPGQSVNEDGLVKTNGVAADFMKTMDFQNGRWQNVFGGISG